MLDISWRGALYGIVAAVVAIPMIKKKGRRLRASGVLPLAMKLLDERGLERRWRHGILTVENGTPIFAPAPPRRARSFDLTGTTVVGSRDSRLLERWWISGPIITAVGPLGSIEFAPTKEGVGMLRELVGHSAGAPEAPQS